MAKQSTNPTHLIILGVAIMMLSNPMLYLAVASLTIDVQNLFGASLDRRSVSFDTSDPFIQAMGLVSLAGLALIAIGLWKRRKP